ncbi:UNVERIFIED_CONTAM: hypothetical protein FKN15_034962 [Acipenser sinensis]
MESATAVLFPGESEGYVQSLETYPLKEIGSARECQVKHWQKHKKACELMAETRSSCLSVGMSQGELIELQEMSLEDRIELTPQTPRLERVNALRISPGKLPELLSRVRVIRLLGESLDPRLTDEAGEGHDFQPCTHAQPTWCDLCGDFIWGLYKQSLRCTPSKPCFCQRCNKVEFSLFQDEQKDREKQELSPSEIEQKVREYNAQINSNLFMAMNKDGSYTGFIKVQLKLVRPVSMPPPPRKASSALEVRKGTAVKRRTSFYLPKDTAKHLHISSQTKAHEVIEALLNKFTVVDNPRKFALFERREREDQVYLRKLSDEEQPLHLRLCAGPSEKVLSLVLKENETGDVNVSEDRGAKRILIHEACRRRDA